MIKLAQVGDENNNSEHEAGFNSFWKITLERWENTPVKKRNFLKRIGLEPNKETSYEAYIALKSTSPQQLSLFSQNAIN